MSWDAQWSSNPDPSGRAALGVHLSAYEAKKTTVPLAAGTSPEDILNNKKARMVDVAATPAVAIST